MFETVADFPKLIDQGDLAALASRYAPNARIHSDRSCETSGEMSALEMLHDVRRKMTELGVHRTEAEVLGCFTVADQHACYLMEHRFKDANGAVLARSRVHYVLEAIDGQCLITNLDVRTIEYTGGQAGADEVSVAVPA